MTEDHTLGIHGNLQNVTADLNHDKAVLVVEHEIPDDGGATSTHITQEQLRKALGVSHINLHNVHAISVESSALNSNGVSAVTVRSGDGTALPTTDRHCHVHDGAMAAAHLITMPGHVASTGEMALKSLQTDKHSFVAHGELTADQKKRNELNAALYATSSAAPSDEMLYKNTVKAEKGGISRVAIPLRQTPTTDDGALTAVASRCILGQQKAPTVLAPDAKIIQMPHKVTGEVCDHLLASADSVEQMARTIKDNTKVHGTFGSGLTIDTHALGNSHQPGDTVVHKITLHRTPTGEANKVTYIRDLVPDGVVAPTNGANEAPGMEAEWHKAMFKSAPSSTKTAVATTVQHDHELAGEPINANGPDGSSA